LLRRLAAVDLVVVEGFKAYAHPKIEVHRAANGKPFLFETIANVKAVASDVPPPTGSIPAIRLDDVAAVADAVLAHAEPIADVVASLAAHPVPQRVRLSHTAVAPDS
jgi:molybdopterin-guanine dinucleotide biosynthesis protein B